MRLLRMKPEYITWTKEGKKTATTRDHSKPMTRYELVSGSRYKPVKSGVVVGVSKVYRWTRKELLLPQNKAMQAEIVKAENFSSFDELWSVLSDILGEKLTDETPLFTHFYKVLEVWDEGDMKA